MGGTGLKGFHRRLARRDFALLCAAVAMGAGSVPFDPAQAVALTYQPVTQAFGPVVNSSSDCQVVDTFNRTVAAGWGSTDTGQAWTDSRYDSAGNLVSVGPVNGSVNGGVGSVARSTNTLEFSGQVLS